MSGEVIRVADSRLEVRPGQFEMRKVRHQGAMAMLWDNVQGQSTVKVSLCPTGGHTSWKSMVESDQKFFWAATLRLRGRATDRGRRISIKHLIFCDRLSPNQNWTATGHVSEHDTARHHWTVRCPPCESMRCILANRGKAARGAGIMDCVEFHRERSTLNAQRSALINISRQSLNGHRVRQYPCTWEWYEVELWIW